MTSIGKIEHAPEMRAQGKPLQPGHCVLPATRDCMWCTGWHLALCSPMYNPAPHSAALSSMVCTYFVAGHRFVRTENIAFSVPSS
eukprot:2822542-Karenia_brevis.AAC.1